MKKLILIALAGAMGLLITVAAFAEGGVEKNRYRGEKCKLEVKALCGATSSSTVSLN